MLFYALTVVSVILIPLTNQLSLDLNVHDTYFILTYFHYLVAIGLMSLITGLLYSCMSKLKKPVALKIAVVHFVLIIMGLIFSINVYGLIAMLTLAGAPDTSAFAFDLHLLISYLTGPILLILGACVFVYGIITALTKKQASVDRKN